MRRYALAAIAAALVTNASPAVRAQTRPVPTVTVLGEGSVSVKPDTAIISAGVITQGKTAHEASEANGRMMAPLLAALKDAGIADADVQTSRLSIQPLHEPSRGSANKIVGFQASNQITIRLRDISKVSDIIDRLVGAGANSLSGVEFLVADPSKALDQARRDSMADAKRKAEIYATAASAGLGRVVSVEEQGTVPRYGRMAAAAPGGSTPIATGEETLRITTTVTYELGY